MGKFNKPSHGLLGFCVADALGVPVEFKHRVLLSAHPVMEMRGNGTHKQEPGTWSDDSSQVFCVTESLCEGYNLQSIADSLHDWYYENHWTARGRVFDVGATTCAALELLHMGARPEKSGLNDFMDNGNGSLMRTLPLAYYLKNEWDFKYRQSIIHEVSAITHAHPISQIACLLYTEFAIQLLHGVDPGLAYSYCQELGKALYDSPEYKQFLPVYSRIINNKIYELEEREIRSSGYAVDTLEACLWSIFKGSNYLNTVTCAVNLGNDTDTIGALTGGLAGILYGYNEIPLDWLDAIARLDDIIALAKRFEKKLIDFEAK
ncbi:MAG: ADP-ribosylglycohydrolase family protein [Candidatus Margulisbacteria bacterium]|nr:ADP-ribosylglycohydrolase family protein [Candidatus Margulisiibacteriota bacterium]